MFHFIRFLAIAHDGCLFCTGAKDPYSIGDYDLACTGRLVRLDAELIDEINHLGLYRCLSGSSFDLGCTVVALRQV